MSCRAWSSDIVCPDGSSNTALGRMWTARHRLGCLSAAAGGEPMAIIPDADLHVRLPICPHCHCDMPSAALPFHVDACEQLQSMQRREGLQGRSDAMAAADGVAPRQSNFACKWTELVDKAAREVRLLYSEQSDSSSTTLGASRRRDEAFLSAYDAICTNYRLMLLQGYTQEERELPSELLLSEACHLYHACYTRASRLQEASAARAQASGEHSHPAGLAFAWNVAGPWLCHVKAKQLLHTTHPGACPRVLPPTVLQKMLSRGRRAASSSEHEPAGGEVEGGAGDDGDDIVSTPWSRCE